MTIKVTKDYVDKNTKIMRKVGTTLRNVPDQRAQELITAGVAEMILENGSAEGKGEVK